MFEDLIREVERLERGFTVSVRIPEDRKGYVDRQCQSSNCKALFKVFGSDWDAKVGKKRAFCPLCRHEAQADQWTTKQQREYVRAVALQEMRDHVHSALEAGVRSFNRQRQSGFLTFSLSVTRDTTPVFLPRAVGDIMEQSFTCETCSCRYSSIGAAFFCPACGHNSALTTFSQTIETVRNTMASMRKIRESFGNDEDAAENAARMVTEQALARLVGAFERFTEALFPKVPGSPLAKVKRGSFQRLSEASLLWREAIGKGYEDLLLPSEFAELFQLFQKRHLLTHCDGVVDADYLQKSGDTNYGIGQRIVVRESHVLRLSDLISKIKDGLIKFVP